MKISIVIPVYNEAEYIGACLESIARQTVMPYEVIVVDNGSTDSTKNIAESFSFVKVLSEKQQGVVYARDKGFNAASGDIIGRLDADTLLTPEWCDSVIEIFKDQSLTAFSGSLDYYDGPDPLARLISSIDSACQQWAANHVGPYVHLNGCNMAVRRSAWLEVRDSICKRLDVHEDQDLAIHLAKLGMKVSLEPNLKAGISGRLIDKPPKRFYHYAHCTIYTYKQHDLRERNAYYPFFLLIMLGYLPLRFSYRRYIAMTKSSSLAQQILAGKRADPVIAPLKERYRSRKAKLASLDLKD